MRIHYGEQANTKHKKLNRLKYIGGDDNKFLTNHATAQQNSLWLEAW